MALPIDLRALEGAARRDPGRLPELLGAAAATFGCSDLDVYLIDFQQRQLLPVARARRPGQGMASPEDVATTMAGRAFSTQAPVLTERSDGDRVWVPVLEGSACSGVLATTITDDAPETVALVAELGVLAGLLIAAHARSTDAYGIARMGRTMSLAASMQWDLLPPLVLKANGASAAGMLEPAYDVGGDAFDYVVNDRMLDVAIIDAMGHGVGASVVSALTIGAYRHARRLGLDLVGMHGAVDSALREHYGGEAFATGQLGRLDLDTGELHWVNAGHPLPLLLRGGRNIGELRCAPTVPWGLGPSAPEASTEQLEPGDLVLFHTDGVVEKGVEGQAAGTEWLADLAARHSSADMEPEQVARSLVRAVWDRQGEKLTDDATVVVVRYDGARR